MKMKLLRISLGKTNLQKLQLQLGPSQVLIRHLKASKFSVDLIEFGTWLQILAPSYRILLKTYCVWLTLGTIRSKDLLDEYLTHLVGIIFSYIVDLGNVRFCRFR